MSGMFRKIPSMVGAARRKVSRKGPSLARAAVRSPSRRVRCRRSLSIQGSAGARVGGAHGVTLLEVLVALLVLSLGVLALAHAQWTALQATRSAQQRTIATLLLTDLTERLWLEKAAQHFRQREPGPEWPVPQPASPVGVHTPEWLMEWVTTRQCASRSGHACLPDLHVELGNWSDSLASGNVEIRLSWLERRTLAGEWQRTEWVFPVFLPAFSRPPYTDAALQHAAWGWKLQPWKLQPLAGNQVSSRSSVLLSPPRSYVSPAASPSCGKRSPYGCVGSPA